MTSKIKIAPSVLACDFSRLGEELHRVESAGCDMIHVDVMDGHFVPNLTVGPLIVTAIRKLTRLPLDVHLMIDEPWKYIPQFVDAGSNHITVHEEACPGRLSPVLADLAKRGVGRGVSIRPRTPASVLLPYLDQIDMILVMTVEPGFGGQSFMPDMIPKIRELRKVYKGLIEVDGGINAQTAKLTREAGADVLVAGTAIFGSADVKKTMEAMRLS